MNACDSDDFLFKVLNLPAIGTLNLPDETIKKLVAQLLNVEGTKIALRRHQNIEVKPFWKIVKAQFSLCCSLNCSLSANVDHSVNPILVMVKSRPRRQRKQLSSPHISSPSIADMTLGQYLDALLQAEIAELKAAAEEALQKFDRDVDRIEEEIKRAARKKMDELEPAGTQA